MALTLSLLLFFSSLLIQMILSRADKKEIVKEIGDRNEAIIKKIGDRNEAIIAKIDELIDVIKKKP